MRVLCLLISLSGWFGFLELSQAADQSIRGMVHVSKELEGKLPKKGVLFIFARTPGQRPPVAVIRKVNPTFPYSFRLGPDHVMIPGGQFKGLFDLIARFSPSGNALQKKGSFEGTTTEGVQVQPGLKRVVVTLDQAK